MHSWPNLGLQDKDPESVLQLSVLRNSKYREFENFISLVLQLSTATFPSLLLSNLREEI